MTRNITRIFIQWCKQRDRNDRMNDKQALEVRYQASETWDRDGQTHRRYHHASTPSSTTTSKYPGDLGPSEPVTSAFFPLSFLLGLKSSLGLAKPALIFLIVSKVDCNLVWLLDATAAVSFDGSELFLAHPFGADDPAQLVARLSGGGLARLNEC